MAITPVKSIYFSDPGDAPKLLRIVGNQVSLLDEDGVSDDDAFNLYLLTSQAIFSGDTMELFHEINCLSLERIREALKTQDVSLLIAQKIKESYKKNMGVSVNVDQEDLSVVMDELLGFFANLNMK